MVWATFDPPTDTWLGCGLQGSLISDHAVYPTRDWHDGANSFVELVGQSDEWGQLYRIDIVCAPGGVRANQATVALLAWRAKTGEWRILWVGDGDYSWSMGYYYVSYRTVFTVGERIASSRSGLPFRIDVHRERSDHLSSGHGGPTVGQGGPLVCVQQHRYGHLAGYIPMEIKWTTSWHWEVDEGETWWTIAEDLRYLRRVGPGEYHDAEIWIEALKGANPSVTSQALTTGTWLTMPSRDDVSAATSRRLPTRVQP